MPIKDKSSYNLYMKDYLRLKREQKYNNRSGLTNDVCLQRVNPIINNEACENFVSELKYNDKSRLTNDEWSGVNPFVSFNFWKSKITCVQNQLLSIYPIYDMKKRWSRNISPALNDIKKFNYKSSELKRKQVQITLLDGRIVYFKRK